MGCDHDALRWLQAENIRRVEIALRIGLVAANDFGPQNAVPWKARALGHVGQQADVPVRQRGDQEPRAEQVQSLDGIRTWIQPMPCHVKVQQFVVRESNSLDAGVSQAVPKIYEMQAVKADTRQPSTANGI